MRCVWLQREAKYRRSYLARLPRDIIDYLISPYLTGLSFYEAPFQVDRVSLLDSQNQVISLEDRSFSQESNLGYLVRKDNYCLRRSDGKTLWNVTPFDPMEYARYQRQMGTGMINQMPISVSTTNIRIYICPDENYIIVMVDCYLWVFNWNETTKNPVATIKFDDYNPLTNLLFQGNQLLVKVKKTYDCYPLDFTQLLAGQVIKFNIGTRESREAPWELKDRTFTRFYHFLTGQKISHLRLVDSNRFAALILEDATAKICLFDLQGTLLKTIYDPQITPDTILAGTYQVNLICYNVNQTGIFQIN